LNIGIQLSVVFGLDRDGSGRDRGIARKAVVLIVLDVSNRFTAAHVTGQRTGCCFTRLVLDALGHGFGDVVQGRVDLSRGIGHNVDVAGAGIHF